MSKRDTIFFVSLTTNLLVSEKGGGERPSYCSFLHTLSAMFHIYLAAPANISINPNIIRGGPIARSNLNVLKAPGTSGFGGAPMKAVGPKTVIKFSIIMVPGIVVTNTRIAPGIMIHQYLQLLTDEGA